VLLQCGQYPEPRLVIVMDNCATYRRSDVEALYLARRVIVKFLPPYLPDYNPIELSFRLFKHWIKDNVHLMPVYGEAD
jgi:transposase